MPAAAEDVMISRDIALAESTGGRLHVMHVSTSGSVEILRRAKRRNVRVTAEATPHHFTLTDECLRTFNSNFKMNPPLRSRDHVEAIIAGLADGTIDAIATDHAPHAAEKKMQELDRAPFGVVGLETALGLLMVLVHRGDLDLNLLIEKLTFGPARTLDLPYGTLREGAAADITIFNPDEEWLVDPQTFVSKGKNTPLAGLGLRGRVVCTVSGGQIVYVTGERAQKALGVEA
jgi:dihydroorotase